jgi:serine/threonine protein kinase
MLSDMDWLLRPDELEIGAPIASGAQGAVFRGRLLATGDDVAVKKFVVNDEATVEVFRLEVRLLSRFRHPAIIMFRGAVVSRDLCVAVTELCRESLYARLARAAPLPWPRRVRWMRDIARAMSYLHSRQPAVIHRDLKSLNVLVDDGGNVKLCDFGMARTCEHTFVATRHIAGSPSWMAPEVLRGDDFNALSDVYSYGVILWEIATRTVPWPSKTMAQLVGLVGFSGATLAPPTVAATGCPAGLPALIARCFLPAAERPSFAELRDAVDALAVDTDMD